MDDIIGDIPTFVVVAEQGNFSGAARRLGMTRSAVSRSVARLEARLGVTLIHRTTRAQGLTPEGERFVERCRQVVEALGAAIGAVEGQDTDVVGTLRVAMPVLFGRLHVAPALLRIAGQHARLSLEIAFNDRFVDLIGDGFDLAIRNGPLVVQAGLSARRLVTERILLCASPEYVARHGEPDDLAALARHDAVVYRHRHGAHVWRFPTDDGKTPVDSTPPSRLRFDDLGMVRDAAAAGYGIAWLPDWLIADDLRNGVLRRILPDAPALATDIFLVWPTVTRMPPRLRVAIDALVTAFGAAS